MAGIVFPDNLARAVAFEREAYDFYKRALERSRNAMARAAFVLLMEEENKHSAYLTELHEVMAEGGVWPDRITISMDRDFKLVFKEAREKIEEMVDISTGEIEAFRLAIDLEYRGRDMYLDLVSKSADDRESGLYSMLADWELEHARFLTDHYDFFADEGLRMDE